MHILHYGNKKLIGKLRKMRHIRREVSLWKNMNTFGKSERVGMHANICNLNIVWDFIWSLKINFLLKSLNEVMDNEIGCKERQDGIRNK